MEILIFLAGVAVGVAAMYWRQRSEGRATTADGGPGEEPK